MNIFVTDLCPILSAKALDNKRLVKMILESAQLLSAAIYLNSDETVYPDIYKPTHLKHPCTIWASENRSNWLWLYDHFMALCAEYTFRYGKEHKSQSLSAALLKYSTCLPDAKDKTPFANCTKSDDLKCNFKNHPDTLEAYQQYLCVKWNNDKFKPKWTNREAPQWYKIDD